MPLRVVAAQAPPAPQSAIWVIAPRYATHGEAALLAARIYPRWAIAEEFTYDVHKSDDWSLGVATGPQFHIGHVSLIAIGGAVVAPGTWFAVLYVAPTVPLGPLTASGTIELFYPITSSARFEYELSHTRLLAEITHQFRAGAFFHLIKSLGDPARKELGPSLRMQVTPALRFTVDAAHGFGLTPSEFVFTARGSGDSEGTGIGSHTRP